MPLGIYISVPFCRTKCSYCNFASDVFSRAVFERYVQRVCEDLRNAERIAQDMGGEIERTVDSIYLGGGTPTVLDSAQLECTFANVRSEFDVSADAEITVECAPGTLSLSMLESLLRSGVNRVSLGVQSFVDQEAAGVGRLHNRASVREDIGRLRAVGITNINVDLVAGLPHQTAESWDESLAEVIAACVPHVSVYMLEVDEDSRLGRELMAGGTRYHAHFVPDDDAIADFFVAACERLRSGGITQYEISNFARPGFESRHNLKYWTRLPYLGFGLDAHSMLHSAGRGFDAVRFSSADSLEQYMSAFFLPPTLVTTQAAIEEGFFLGLRLNRGVSFRELSAKFGEELLTNSRAIASKFVEDGLMEVSEDSVRLTSRGRLLSNEVFAAFIFGEKDGPHGKPLAASANTSAQPCPT